MRGTVLDPDSVAAAFLELDLRVRSHSGQIEHDLAQIRLVSDEDCELRGRVSE